MFQSSGSTAGSAIRVPTALPARLALYRVRRRLYKCAHAAVMQELQHDRPVLGAEQNDLITHRSGTRRYLVPAILATGCAGRRAFEQPSVKPVRLLGESLVLFRDDASRYGLLERACPSWRDALRMDGSKMEVCGAPSMAGYSTLRASACRRRPEARQPALARIYRQRAYPVVRRRILFAYMGPGEPPEFPHFDCFTAACHPSPSKA